MVAKKTPAKKTAPKVIPDGTPVSWPYRGAIGHGTVVSVAKKGTSAARTEYNVREVDHHTSATGSREKAIVKHYGSALTKTSKAAVSNARKTARARKAR